MRPSPLASSEQVFWNLNSFEDYLTRVVHQYVTFSSNF
ncbi:unnamed protein product [Brassica napus]|uniref:(rape) hypothetical protein n=1 Tax=Brassica napus TaxID=3708 RepID=A0A816K3I1_BRANA|nr:unnamed protein product [Brassica napus]